VDKGSLVAPAKSHLLHVVRALLRAGWSIQGVPASGRLLRNGQKMLLRTDQHDLRLRLFVYKVTESSRQRPVERRIEITSTYRKGLKKLSSYPDVVLGYETDKSLFVGVDAERISHGGATGNASSFFDIEGLKTAREGGITILQRKAKTELFQRGFEFHAFFSSDRIAEYLFNQSNVHDGTYLGDGEYSGKVRKRASNGVSLAYKGTAKGDVLILAGPSDTRRSRGYRVNEQVISTIERGEFPAKARKIRKITPEEFIEIKRVMEENGALGEEHVMDAERRRLRRAGLSNLAERIRWISRESVGEGYDIESFEEDGSKRFIEVKASIGKQKTFEISNNEWQTACRLGASYYVYRVSNVRSNPTISRYRDLQELEKKGMIQKTASGWRVTLR
jgi:Domain of unknown function (DUF3883)